MAVERILITVKTYPTLSASYGELVCTAGLLGDGTWIRIYPIPFRRLEEYRKFEKFRFITANVIRNAKDSRPESHKVDFESIQLTNTMLSTRDNWRERREWILSRSVVYDDLAALIAAANTESTVNTVGIMGKGIALMFKERFPENNKAYVAACKAKEVRVGELFVTQSAELDGPRWIINFPTMQHWRNPTKQEWVEDGLVALKQFIVEHGIKSIAIPPLGCGNGGLRWGVVRPLIENSLKDLPETRVVVYEPTSKYQNVAKKQGVQNLTPARALIAEMVRRYWVLGGECTILELQKLAWFLERSLERRDVENVLSLEFQADRYGPFAPKLTHLLNGLDGSYLHCEKRLPDAKPMDTIWFGEAKREHVALFLKTECQEWLPALEETDALIDGFQTPLGLEALATVDWLISREGTDPSVGAIRKALDSWPGGSSAGERKQRLFDDNILELAMEQLS